MSYDIENARYSGTSIDYSTIQKNYVNVLEVVDLGSACGQENSYVIRELTIVKDSIVNHSALACCGYSLVGNAIDDGNGSIYEAGSRDWWCLGVDAVIAYGNYDVLHEELVTGETRDEVESNLSRELIRYE